MIVNLQADTLAFVELSHDGSWCNAQLRHLEDAVPLPRRLIAGALRNLADNLDKFAGELENLEHTT